MVDSQASSVAPDAQIFSEVTHEGPAGNRRTERSFPCSSCGADLVYQPGAADLTCPYCRHREVIPRDARTIREFALAEYVPPPKPVDSGRGLVQMACVACAAQVEVPPETAAKPCPYCGGTLLAKALTEAAAAAQAACEAILPFKIPRQQAELAVQRWVKSLWFAPSDLLRAVTMERFSSLYQPWWTFDSHTLSHYSGDAGYHYTVTVGEGKNRRTETRTRWESRDGVHEEFIDDQPVPAGEFREWRDGFDFKQLVPYDQSFLAGHSATTATRDPQRGWQDAKQRIDQRMYEACRREIGGDTQRNVEVVTAHRAVTYKLIMLPRWQGGFRYRGRAFVIAVNGQTGGVVGDRPWSAIKITLAVIAGLVVAGGVFYLFNK